LAGRVADRFPRRPLVAAGYGLAAAGKVVIAIATVWPLVLVGRAVDRFGKGVRGAPRDALLVDGVPLEARGRVFGLHRAADTSGAVVGPLIGLAGYEALHHHIRPLLVIAVIPAVLSVALVAAVREPSRPAHDESRGVSTSGPLPPGFWRVVTVIVIFSLANFPDALLLLRVKALGFDLPGVILVYVAYNTAYAALSYPAGALADRLSPARVYGVGLCCFAVGYLGLGVIADGRWVWPLLIVYGGFTAATDGVGKAWISRLVPTNQQGQAQGWFQGLTGAAVLVAGVWAGVFWHDTGTTPLIVSGCVGAAVAALLLVRPSFLADG
jgi:MFS family permease